MTSIQDFQAKISTPSGVDDTAESPTPMDIPATDTKAAFLLPAACAEADLRVRELGADVDNLTRQSTEASAAYMVAIQRVHQRGAGEGGLDERELRL
jgi:hypothetical protein